MKDWLSFIGKVLGLIFMAGTSLYVTCDSIGKIFELFDE